MPSGQSAIPQTRVRWWILFLLFLATTINYMDRIAFGFLVGQVMKATGGRADPERVNALLRRELEQV